MIPSALASDINVNETGWWGEGAVFNASGTPIQHAIYNASAGNTINVAEGTYNENILINKSLILNGANVGVPGTGTRGTESTINASVPANYVVEITANNVTLDGFNITGLTGSGENVGTVMVQGKDYCTITNNILDDNYKDGINLFKTGGEYSDYNTVSNNLITSPGSGGAFAIKIKGSHNTISGNTITDGWRWAIHLWSYDTSETVSPDYNVIANNIITGTGAYDERGIVCKTGAYTEVTNNTITGIIYAPIYFYTSDRIVGETNFDPRPNNCIISDNTITGGEAGIALLEGCNNFTLSNNTITGGTVQGKITQAGILGGLSRWSSDWVGKTLAYTNDTNYLNYLQITDNTISNNNITNCGHGVAMQYADRNILTQNNITGNTNIAAIDWWSINVELAFTADYAGIYFNANSSDNVVNYNNIVNNTGGLKNANTGETLDAENNYWGDASGAYHAITNPGGSGDNASDNVDFEPWLITSYPSALTKETETETIDGDGTMTDTCTGGDVSIAAIGNHTIVAAKYATNPAGTPTFKATGNYWDVYMGNVTGVASLRIDFCPVSSGDTIYYWDDATATWKPCSYQNFVGGCIKVTITSSTEPSLNDLTGEEFGHGALDETLYETISFEIAETNIKMMIMGLALIPIITILTILIAAIYRREETDWRIVLTLFAAIGIASALLLVFFVMVVVIQTA